MWVQSNVQQEALGKGNLEMRQQQKVMIGVCRSLQCEKYIISYYIAIL